MLKEVYCCKPQEISLPSFFTFAISKTNSIFGDELSLEFL